jgi:ferredoxin-NADP reductase
VVHVLSHPDRDWQGEKGHINASVLSRRLSGSEHRHLPARCRRLVYFICGPNAMMDATENALAHLGVPAEKVHTERFGMV